MTGLLIAIILMLLHHLYIHRNDNKPFIDKLFQYDDVNNHETFILFLFGVYVGGMLCVNKKTNSNTSF